MDKQITLTQRLNLNGALIYAGSLAWVFFVIFTTGNKARTIYVMNAFLFGSIISLCITYARYIWYAIVSAEPYTRARQFALSSGVLWLSVWVSVIASIIRHSSGDYNISSTSFFDLASRYLAIIAATMQVFSPSYGEHLFYGVERKLLVTGAVIGFAFALIVIVIQALDLLKM